MTFAELIKEETKLSHTDLPWMLRQDGFGQINPMTTVSPLFYHRHDISPPVYVDLPEVVKHPWVITTHSLYQCPPLPFDGDNTLSNRHYLISDQTNPFIIVTLPHVIVNELQGIEFFAFAVLRSEIKPYTG